MSDMQEKQFEFVPASELELSRFVRENAEDARLPVYPVGGRTGLQSAPDLDDRRTEQ